MADTKSYISKINLPSGNTYYLKDSRIDGIQIVNFIGITTDDLTDGCDINPINIITGQNNEVDISKSVIPTNGNIVLKRTPQNIETTEKEQRTPIPAGVSMPNTSTPNTIISSTNNTKVTMATTSYTDTETNEYVTITVLTTTTYEASEEYIFCNGYWNLLGSIDSKELGDFAYVNEGKVTVPELINITATPNTSEKGAKVSDYTPRGTISKPDINITPTTANVNIAMTVTDEILTFSFIQDGESVNEINIDTITDISAESTVPEFIGDQADIRVTYDAIDSIECMGIIQDTTYTVVPNTIV